MGVIQAAGLSLRWFRDRFGTLEERIDRYEALSAEAATAPAGADGLLWAPYLMAERTPHLDPYARAAFIGLSLSHTRAHLIRAILEGVTFRLRDTFTILREMRVPIVSMKARRSVRPFSLESRRRCGARSTMRAPPRRTSPSVLFRVRRRFLR